MIAIKHIHNSFAKRVKEKRNAYARVGSIFVIERVMSQFLRKFREQRNRRTYSKIKFWATSYVVFTKGITENKAKFVVTQFFKDLRDIRMMFRSFSSVDRKVKIIQK